MGEDNNKPSREDYITKKFSVSVGVDGVIYLTLGGSLEGLNCEALRSWSEKVRKVIYQEHDNRRAPVKVAVDIDGITGYSTEAIEILKKLLRANEQYVYRTATYGGSTYIKLAQTMLTSLSGRHNFKNFKTKEDAIAWLNSSE